MHWLRSILALALLSAALICAAFPAAAVQPDEVLPDAAMESRARALSKDLRCMVCQNQSIDDSDAPLARDLRVLVRERLKAGDSDTQVIDYLVSRYGEFVLLNPRLGRHTLILWLGPLAVLVAGAIGLVLLLRRRRRESVPELVAAKALTPAEEARLAKLLDQPGAGSSPDR